MKILRSEKGEMGLGDMVFWLVVAVGGYCAFQMAMPWVKFKQVEELFRNEIASMKVKKVKTVKKETHARLEEMGVKLYVAEENDWEGLRIKVTRGEPAVMEATYMEEVVLPGGLYRHTYTFHPRAESKVIINPRDE
ncbi:MAG: hypothetical protein IMF07_01295 [Proteobacteria bacterium]|nr:hypothetical protein [Pseudomonadota bacterium]